MCDFPFILLNREVEDSCLTACAGLPGFAVCCCRPRRTTVPKYIRFQLLCVADPGLGSFMRFFAISPILFFPLGPSQPIFFFLIVVVIFFSLTPFDHFPLLGSAQGGYGRVFASYLPPSTGPLQWSISPCPKVFYQTATLPLFLCFFFFGVLSFEHVTHHA